MAANDASGQSCENCSPFEALGQLLPLVSLSNRMCSGGLRRQQFLRIRFAGRQMPLRVVWPGAVVGMCC